MNLRATVSVVTAVAERGAFAQIEWAGGGCWWCRGNTSATPTAEGVTRLQAGCKWERMIVMVMLIGVDGTMRNAMNEWVGRDV